MAGFEGPATHSTWPESGLAKAEGKMTSSQRCLRQQESSFGAVEDMRSSRGFQSSACVHPRCLSARLASQLPAFPDTTKGTKGDAMAVKFPEHKEGRSSRQASLQWGLRTRPPYCHQESSGCRPSAGIRTFGLLLSGNEFLCRTRRSEEHTSELQSLRHL